jgi:plastocyanin
VRIFDDPSKPETQWGYAPGVIRVAVGTRVTFTNGGAVFHSVTSDDPSRAFDAAVDPGESVAIRFDKTGTWTYHCGIHPDMKGVVTVCSGPCS